MSSTPSAAEVPFDIPAGFVRADRKEIAWLERAAGETFFTGVDPTPAFPAAARIYHAMYEAPMPAPEEITHHSVRQVELESGSAEPDLVAGLNLDALGVLTGVGGGWYDPPVGWCRLHWHELARRTGATFDATWWGHGGFAPWPPSGSWPSAIEPPPEGSLDPASAAALLEILMGMADGACFAYTELLFSREEPLSSVIVRGELSRAAELSASPAFGFSAHNWWPDDRAWAVWTDYDLNTTTVAGAPEVVAQVVAHPELEALPTLMAVA